MRDLDLALLLAVERVRLVWEFNAKEVDIHRQRLLQLFITFVTLGLSTVAALLLDRAPREPAMAFAAAMFLGAAYVHVRMILLPRRLRRALDVGLDHLDSLMREEGR